MSTAKGAEGIDVQNRREIITAEDDESFATAIVDVLRRPDSYREQTAAALQLVEDRYSIRTLERRLDEALPLHEVRLSQRSQLCSGRNR